MHFSTKDFVSFASFMPMSLIISPFKNKNLVHKLETENKKIKPCPLLASLSSCGFQNHFVKMQVSYNLFEIL